MSRAPSKNISGSTKPLPTTLSWSDELRKRVRTGDWQDQAVSTTRKIRESIEAGEWELAAQLIDYWMEEAKVVYVIYQVWSEGFVEHLRSRGVPGAEIDAEIDRLARLLAFPDGGRYEPAPRWEELGRAAGLLANRLRGYETSADEALAALDELREGWRQLHDRGADYQSGMLTFIARRFGEEAIGEAYADVLAPYLQERYKPFDVREQPYEDTLFRNIYLSVEAMRGHLVGPARDGDMEVDEDDERIVISFDPCGSGGRSQRGDPSKGQDPAPSRPTTSASPRRSTTGRGTRKGSATTARTAVSRSSTGPRRPGAIHCASSTPRSTRTRRKGRTRRSARGRSTSPSTPSRRRRTSGSACRSRPDPPGGSA